MNMITTSEAAELLGVSTSRVRHYYLDGRIPGQKRDGILFFVRRDVERFAAIPRVRGVRTGVNGKNRG